MIKDLKKQLQQKEIENASLIKANEEIAQKENEKALLVRDLQNQLEQKGNENSSLIKAKEEIAQKENEKALLVRDLQKQLARTEKEFVQKANEHASLVRDFEIRTHVFDSFSIAMLASLKESMVTESAGFLRLGRFWSCLARYSSILEILVFL